MRAQRRARGVLGAGGVGGGGCWGRGSRSAGGAAADGVLLHDADITTTISVGGRECLPAAQGSCRASLLIYFLPLFLGRRTWWMLGITPPEAMVTLESSLESSSSLRMAS